MRQPFSEVLEAALGLSTSTCFNVLVSALSTLIGTDWDWLGITTSQMN